MGRSKKEERRYVIFASPEQYARPGTTYYAWDGSVTDMKTKAATFLTFQEARDFARNKNVVLEASIPYVGEETFSQHEMSVMFRG